MARGEPGSNQGTRRCASAGEIRSTSIPSDRATPRSACRRASPTSVYAALTLPERWNSSACPVSRSKRASVSVASSVRRAMISFGCAFVFVRPAARGDVCEPGAC